MESLPSSEVRQHLVGDALRRYAALIVAVGLVLGAAGYFLASKQPKVFTGQAKVLIRATTGNSLSPDSATSGQRVTVAMVTEAALVDSPAVADGVAKSLGVSTATAVQAVDATVPTNTQLVEISYTAGSASVAQKGAQSFAVAFLAYRKSLSDTVVKAQLGNLGKQQQEVTANLKAAGQAASVADAKPDANAQVQLYAGRLATIQNNIAAANATDTNPGAVVTPAVLPVEDASLVDKLIAPAAAVVGLILGFLLALWLVRRDDRIRARSQQSFFGAPVLTAVAGKARVVSDGSDDAVSESYRGARAGLLATRGEAGKVFAVVGASEGVQVGDVAVNLGVALGRAGYRVAVVDATAGWEDLGADLGVTSPTGFSDLLREKVPALTTVSVKGVDLLSGGPEAVVSKDLFHSDEMALAVGTIGLAHDFGLLAGAGVTTAEGSGVVLVADSVVLVAEDRRTTHADLGEAMQRCRELGTPVVGVIVVPRTTVRRRPVSSPTRSSVRRGQAVEEPLETTSRG